MKKHVIAVIGCGRIAQNAHFKALSQIPGVTVKYACDIILEKARAMQKQYPTLVVQCITDYRVALADDTVEAVLVLTPNDTHYTITMDALHAGKHVLCEKPIAVSYALACEMAEEAERQKRLLCIGVCNRYHASVERLAEMYAKGELGEVYHSVCSFRTFRGIPGLGGPFTTKAHSGGGVLIDWGIHFLDLILFVLGGAKLQRVSAVTYSKMAQDMAQYRYRSMWAEETADIQNGTNDVEDYVSGFVHTDKATISLNGAWAQNVRPSEMYIDFLGSKRGARLNYGAQIRISDGETLETTETEHELPDMYLREDADFLHAIREGQLPRNHISHVLESMRLVDALYRSAELGKEIIL